jgi:Icc-related predicted phosphoesterase
MRVHVMSDIHFEFMQKEEGDEFFSQLEKLLAEKPAETLILAGDICQIGRHELFFKARLARLCGYYKKVLYVPGNHEYYRFSFIEGDQFFEQIDQDPNFHNFIQLDHGPYEIDGQRFIGNTMWFPEIEKDHYVKRMMSDFHVIGRYDSPFEPNVYRRHQDFLDRVIVKLKRGDVVITHHTPLPESIDAQYKGSPINPFFMADMSGNLYEGTLPKLWIHGHTHSPFDYEYAVGTEKMRVYCNPLGYPREGENNRFWDRVVLDIP